MLGIIIENGDLQVSNEAMVIDNVDYQIAEAVLLAVPGELREVPTMGMNVRGILGGSVDTFFAGKLKTQLKTQHLNPTKVSMSIDEIAVEL